MASELRAGEPSQSIAAVITETYRLLGEKRMIKALLASVWITQKIPMLLMEADHGWPSVGKIMK